MMYDDGFPMDDNLRVTECPRCKNSQFSTEANFCRICGTSLYNLCEGEEVYDYNDVYQGMEQHRNPGNARFCEKCGKPTSFLKEKFLLPFNEVNERYAKQYFTENPSNSEDEDDLPF